MELSLDVTCYIYIFPGGLIEQSRSDGTDFLYRVALAQAGVRVLRVLKYSGLVQQLTQDLNDDLYYVWGEVNVH